MSVGALAKRWCFVLALLLTTTGAAHAQSTHAGPDSLYPDFSLTPGATFDGVTADQICVPGYSRSVRNVPSAERARVYAEYGLQDRPGADEVDHFIPLELGGSNDIANLWPEPYTAPGAHEKDRVENYLHVMVCSGAISLPEAQHMIVNDWYAVYLSLGEPAAAIDLSGAPSNPPATDGSSTTPATSPASQPVSFSSVTGGPLGGNASVTVQADPGASCWVQYVTPSGTKSTARGQSANSSKTIGQDGTASWTWAIGPSTSPGTGIVTATCSTGTATTPIAIG
jgi:hypothetical protein